jgi:hypothetical protein
VSGRGAAAAALRLATSGHALRFRALDQAVGTDERPYDAATAMQLRDDLAVTARDRWYTAGVAYQDGTDVMALSSPWPVPWGPWRCYVPARPRAMEMLLALDGVALGTLGPGEPALRVCLTTIDAAGVYRLPPTDPGQWSLLETGTEGVVRVPLASPLPERGGWLGVLLWTWSLAGDDDQIVASGDVVSLGQAFDPAILLELNAAHSTEEWPHWQVELVSDKGMGSVSHLLGVGSRFGTRLQVYPTTRDVGSGEDWGYVIRPLGHMRVQSLVLRVDADEPLVPGRPAYASRAEIAGAVEVPLVGAASTLVRTRVPTWGGMPVAPRVKLGNVQRDIPWLGWLAGPSLDTDAPSVETPMPLGSALIDHDLPDSVGLTSVATLVTLSRPGVQREAPRQLRARLAAYAIGGTTPIAMSEEVTEPHPDYTLRSTSAERWSAVNVIVHQRLWRWTGSLMGRREDVGQALRDYVRHVQVDWVWTEADRAALAAEGWAVDVRLEVLWGGIVFTVPWGRAYCTSCWIASLPREVGP